MESQSSGIAMFSLRVNFENHMKTNEVDARIITGIVDDIFKNSLNNRYSDRKKVKSNKLFAMAKPVTPKTAKNNASHEM